jgi:hypothetical protein
LNRTAVIQVTTNPADLSSCLLDTTLEKKAGQIKRAGPLPEDELAGVILCDGGCAAISHSASFGGVSLQDIVSIFLRSNQTVDFVCVIDVRNSPATQRTSQDLEFNVRTFAKESSSMEVQKILEDGLKRIPHPVRTPVNSLNHLKWISKKPRPSCADYKRTSTMTHHTVEISVRATLDYIAGRIDRAEFERIVNPGILEQLKRMLDEGSGVSSVTMGAPVNDDEGLLIRFSDHDAANAPFRVRE